MLGCNNNNNFSFKLILSCIIGNALEWYDFIIYGYFAPILGQLFFPAGDRYSQLMYSFGALAAGFIARPIGAIVFGHIGDRTSRILVLMLSIYVMSIPTAIIGCLPTYAQIGFFAPLLLTILRILQGLAIGGEYTGSMVFLVEHAPKHKQGFFGSLATCSLLMGVILGSAVASFTMHIFTPAQLNSFGWRIPFVLSMVGCAIGIYVRRHLNDDPQQSILNKTKKSSPSLIPIKELFNKYLNQIFIIIALDALTAIGFFTLVIFLPSYFQEYLNIPNTITQYINTTNMIIFAITTVIGGCVADRIGYKLALLYPCVILIVITYPVFTLFPVEGIFSVAIAQTILVSVMGLFFGVIPITLVKMFPVEVRCSGIAIAHNISMACFGGTAPLMATYLIKKTDHNLLSPAYLLIFGAVVSLFSLLFINKKTIKEITATSCEIVEENSAQVTEISES